MKVRAVAGPRKGQTGFIRKQRGLLCWVEWSDGPTSAISSFYLERVKS